MIFNINKGQHYSGLHFNLNWNKKVMTRKATFTSLCRYIFDDVDKYDINKLFGFSEGLHHINSARFGWLYNPNNDKIELHSYCYTDGVKSLNNTYICALNIQESAILNISIVNDTYVFDVKSCTLGHTYQKIVKRGSNTKKLGYDLYPYFGGNKCAPHDIEIYLEK